MDESAKIGLGIVGGALILALSYVAYREYDRQRDIDEAKAAIDQIAQIPAEIQRQAAVDSEADRRRRLIAQMEDERRRTLTDAQQCIGGTVVQVNGSTYVQVLGVGGRPVVCAGRMRL